MYHLQKHTFNEIYTNFRIVHGSGMDGKEWDWEEVQRRLQLYNVLLLKINSERQAHRCQLHSAHLKYLNFLKKENNLSPPKAGSKKRRDQIE